MRADRDGDEWVLNGEKVWSSYAQWSDYGILLARTNWDVPKHSGLTMFILPLHAPGVTIKPLRQISGNEEFCQEFLEEVRLADDFVLGGVDGGWNVLLSLLRYSREMTAGTASSGPVFDPARGGEPDPGREIIDFVVGAGRGSDPELRRLIAELVTDNVVSGLLASRIAGLINRPEANPAFGTMAKMFGAVTLQRRYEIELLVRGEATMFWRPEDGGGSKQLDDYLWGRTATIAGGTHEISANTIGEQILRLPKEPAADRGLPFREVARGGG
jgi:alkylation response protein AidB-like acyl-CoA dehydrogenase